MTDLVGKIFEQVKEFLELSPSNFEKNEELIKKIIRNTENIEKIIGEKSIKKKFLKILPVLKNYSSKFSRDLTNLEETSLEKEWSQLALQDLFRLREEVIALQELLQANKKKIRGDLERKKYGFDTESLLHQLESDDSIDKNTRSKISKLLDEMSEEEIAENIEKNEERLSRISNWFLVKKEVENVS